MRAAVVFASRDALLDKAGQSVALGAREAGAEAELVSPSAEARLDEFQLVFLGISAYGLSKRMDAVSFAAGKELVGASVRVFCVHSGSGKNALEEARVLLESKKASVDATLLLECRGFFKHFGKGELGEGELARAQAFGERGAAAFLGRLPLPENEKQRIRGYRK